MGSKSGTASPAVQDDHETAVSSFLDELTSKPGKGEGAFSTDEEPRGADPGDQPEHETTDEVPEEPKAEEPKDEGDEKEVERSAADEALDALSGTEASPDEKTETEEEPEAKADGETEEEVDELEKAKADKEWLKSLKGKTRERFNTLTERLGEREQELESVRSQWEEQKPLIEAGETIKELFDNGLTVDEVDVTHSLALLLKHRPDEGLKHLMSYAEAHAKAHGLQMPGLTTASQETPSQSDSAPEIPEDLQDLVEGEFLSEEEARTLAANRANKTKPAPTQGETRTPTAPAPAPVPAAPPVEQAPAPTGESASQLNADFLAKQGMQVEQMGTAFQTHLRPAMLRMLQEDGLQLNELTPRLQNRYLRQAFTEVKDQLASGGLLPAPKSQTKPATADTDDEEPLSTRGPSRRAVPAHAGSQSPAVLAALDELTAE